MILKREDIKQIVQEYFKNKPVEKVYLFGSYAKGDADETSDVDLLCELDYSKNIGWGFFSWREELEKYLNKKVDVVSGNGLSEFIAPFINRTKTLIYERYAR